MFTLHKLTNHSTMNKGTLTIIGFLCFMTGMIALILSLVGLRISILAAIEDWNRGFAFLVKLILIFGGMIMFYIGRSSDYDPEM